MTPLFLRFKTPEVTLSGFTGGEYLPLPASKGPVFPSLLTLDGYPTSPADCAQKQRSPLKNSGNSSQCFPCVSLRDMVKMFHVKLDILCSLKELERGIPREMDFGSGKKRNPLVYGFFKTIGAIIFRLCYRLRVQGTENIPHYGPAIILPKHQYWTDIPIVSLALNPQLNYVAKTELFKIPYAKTFFSLLGGIPVDREKATKTTDSFRYILQLLSEKEYVVIFPEGTYYPDEIGHGKSRLIRMILRRQGHRGANDNNTMEDHIPFVPMGIQYGRKGLRKTVTVKIGRPIFADGEDEAPRLTSQIMENIAHLSGFPRGQRVIETT